MTFHRIARPWRIWLAAAATTVAMLGSACVDDLGLINRTSPDKVDKRLFEGVWLYVQTTVDVPYSSAISFTGETNFGEAAKVVFDIQEDWLIAYAVVETIEGSEEGWKTHKIRRYWDPDRRDETVEMYVGPPVARWQIKSHFDVKRQYNSYNGAQTNEVVENTSDRPWYQRDFIRVDWHQQGIRPFFYDLGGGVGSDSYFVGQDKPHAPDTMKMDVEGGYLDYVVRTTAWAAGQNYCSTYGLSAYDCAKTEVKARHSFRRLDPKRDYEPIRYHNNEHQDRFGYFLTERYAYHPDWGPTYEGKVSFANRWNLWLNNFDYRKPVDDEGNELDVPCFTDSECDRDGGERCQKTARWFDEGYCAVPEPRPYADRTLKPIIYHINEGWLDEYMEQAYIAADSWTRNFKNAAAWKLYYEEQGLGHVRGCTSHSECGTPDLLADVEVRVLDDGIACHTDSQCGDAVCAADGFCGKVRSCDDDNPCAVGQSCVGGTCQSGGQDVVQRIDTVMTRGSSVIFYGGDEALVTHDNFANDTLQQLAAGSAFVRFVNAAPDSGSVGLSITGGAVNVQIKGGAFGDTPDYDPQDPATADFMAQVPAGSGLALSVQKDGAPLGDANLTADINADTSYIVIYNGSGLVVVGAAFPDSRFGVRFVHASPGEGALNFGLEGVRIEQVTRGESVASQYTFNRTNAFTEGMATEYQNLAGDLQRATVTRAGTRGDVTCYVSDGIGRCVGWGPENKDDAHDRVREIEAGLPDLFVLCENTYDELAATDSQLMEGQPCNGAADCASGSCNNGFCAVDCQSDHICSYGYTCEAGVCTDASGGFETLRSLSNARYTRELADGTLYNPCGDEALVPKPEEPKAIGDTRYSFFYWVNEPQRSGPLGYGPSAADPETGEQLFASAYIYGGAIHTYSQYASDLLDLVNGDLDTEDVITGEWIREWFNSREDQEQDTDTFFAGLTGVEQHAGADQGANPQDDFYQIDAQARMPKHAMVPQRMRYDYEFPELLEYMRHPETLKADLQQMFPAGTAQFSEPLDRIKGTWIEDLLINNEVMLAAPFIDPDGAMSVDDLTEMLSPRSWATHRALRTEEQRMMRLSKRNLYMGEFIDDALFGLAKDLKENKGLDGDALRLRVGQLILQGVLEHEVGHTVGLRHNFSGSTDVFNFFDDYYEIRERDLILCQQDGWCDDIGGESCAIQSCNQDSDCLSPGQTCVDQLCSARDVNNPDQFAATGVCGRQISEQNCTTDSQCQGIEDGAICGQGICYLPAEQYLPRPQMTFNEKAERRTEYQYTTVMDYGGRFNSDLHGLGKYDYAAIRFGYMGLVDVYTDTTKLRDRVEAAALRGGVTPSTYSFFMNSQWWPSRGTGFWHAFNYLTNYIGVEGNLSRMPMPYEQVKYQGEMVDNDVRESLDYAYIQVPYAMCSDEFRGNMGCYYFDQGIDPGEMAAGARTQLQQYYIFDAFKRERLFFGSYGNPMSYYSRIMDRYMRVFGDVGMYYALWDSFLFRYSWYQEWKNAPLGGMTLEQAAIDCFGNLKDIIASPSPGCYVRDDDSDYFRSVSFQDDGSRDCDLYVPFGVGRFPYTQFGGALGYSAQQHPLWFGSFWEKLGALMTLTDSTAYFVDIYVGEQIGAGTSLGFNTVFADDMNNFLGGIVAGELDFYAGRAKDENYIGPSVTGGRTCVGLSAEAIANNECDPVVEPSLNNFTLKLYAALLGLAYLPAGYDPTFIDRMAVFVEGEATHYDHGAQAGIAPQRFVDPIGGKVYIAYSTNYGSFGEDPKVDVGATLVRKAQQLADQWENATGTEKVELEHRITELREVLDILRQLNHVYGTSTLGL